MSKTSRKFLGLLAAVLIGSRSWAAPALEVNQDNLQPAFQFLNGTRYQYLVCTALPSESAVVDFPVTRRQETIGEMLNRWYDEGSAAGNVGDLYENRDRGHSRLNLGQFPQLTPLRYAEEVKRLGYNLQSQVIQRRPLIGNASMAVTGGTFPRSLPRLLFHNTNAGPFYYFLYRANQLYFYPEHKDHDKQDRFAVNTPYLIISQGSSGSDKPFMKAMAQTMAAFRPEVKERLIREGLLMPTLQMIFRSCYVGRSDSRYLSADAHPTVFDATRLDAIGMVEFAHELTPERLPPHVQLSLLSEPEPVLGRDYFDPGMTEKLLTTPNAVARIARGRAFERRYMLSAVLSKDLNSRPLSYHWKVLRGDASRIRFEPQSEDGAIVQLTIPYHEETAAVGGRESFRVDVGVFVHNGLYYSAPAFFTLTFPPNETREYANGKLEAIDYTTQRGYVDGSIFPDKPWRDEMVYREDGSLGGWWRVYENGDREAFSASGERLPKRFSPKDFGRGTRIEYSLGPVNNRRRTVEMSEAASE